MKSGQVPIHKGIPPSSSPTGAQVGSAPPLAALGAWNKPLTWLGNSNDQYQTPLETSSWPALSAKTVGKNAHRHETARIPSTSEKAIPQLLYQQIRSDFLGLLD